MKFRKQQGPANPSKTRDPICESRLLRSLDVIRGGKAGNCQSSHRPALTPSMPFANAPSPAHRSNSLLVVQPFSEPNFLFKPEFESIDDNSLTVGSIGVTYNTASSVLVLPFVF
jgi:hypothetical protein